MFSTKTVIALSAALVLALLGVETTAQAGGNSGEYDGGFVIPGSTEGVNPVYHPGRFGTARHFGRPTNAFAYAPVGSNKHQGRH